MAGLIFWADYFLFLRDVSRLICESERFQLQVLALLKERGAAAEFFSTRPVAVMIENHVDSRPASGLEYARVVYEMIIEGEITRYLALFDGNFEAKKIGPVRSARPFFVALAEEWRAAYFHAGGSPEALQILKQSSIADINEISSDGIYFWRDRLRFAPHNLYTSSDLVKRALAAKAVNLQPDFSPWHFKADRGLDAAAPPPADIAVAISPAAEYQVSYRYNQKYNNYTRYLNGRVQATAAGIILKTKNIVVEHVKYDVIDDYGRLDVDLSGGGAAEIYQDGVIINGIWKKSAGRTRYYDQNGTEVAFNRGPIWIEIVFY